MNKTVLYFVILLLYYSISSYKNRKGNFLSLFAMHTTFVFVVVRKQDSFRKYADQESGPIYFSRSKYQMECWRQHQQARQQTLSEIQTVQQLFLVEQNFWKQQEEEEEESNGAIFLDSDYNFKSFKFQKEISILQFSVPRLKWVCCFSRYQRPICPYCFCMECIQRDFMSHFP